MRKTCFFYLAACAVILSASVYAEGEHFRYDSHGRRDPFVSLVTPTGSIVNFEADFERSDLRVEGIMFDPYGQSAAIINGQVIAAGDYVGNFKVIAIGQEKITFLDSASNPFDVILKKEE